MLHKKIQMTKSMAYGILDELGKMPDSIQFIDLHKEDSEVRKDLVSMISRCDRMEQLFIKFEKICLENNVDIIKYDSYQKFLGDLKEEISVRHVKSGSMYFDMIENEVLEDEKNLDQLISSFEEIRGIYSTLIEKRAVYEKSVQLFKQSQIVRTSFGDEQQRMLEEGFVSDLNYIAGVAKADDELRMKRMIFRISKGRAIPHFFDMPQSNLVNFFNLECL